MPETNSCPSKSQHHAAKPSSPVSFTGKWPWNVLAIHLPSGRRSLPHAYTFPVNSPRAASLPPLTLCFLSAF
jgi:hypothetical protein